MQKDNYESILWTLDLDDIISQHRSKITAAIAKQLRRYLVSGPVLTEGRPGYGRRVELSAANIALWFDDYGRSGIFEQFLFCALHTSQDLNRYLALKICDYVPEMDRQRISKRDLKTLTRMVGETDWSDKLMRELKKRFPRKQVFFYLRKNPRYDAVVEEYENASERNAVLHENMLREIPDDFIDLYPLARQMHRHFVIHVGPTNSGKTYQAMQALRESEKGIYMGPLRLLAYEQFESLNMDDDPCDLVTGEERIEIPSARYQASTVEMFNPEAQYEVAVVDEAQMIADEDRGGSWTSAILGLCAEEIHVCCAAHAVKLIIRLIEDCGDDYEVIHHKRQTPLRVEHQEFVFPNSVRDKDALIVFSKRDVHAVASELQRRGIPCSVIYGSLPYDVRHDEARKFIEGETRVVVATDAIGMGMNLPIQRVVFLATAKFDGKDLRPLHLDEVQQIAGRAGRRGLFDVGYVNAFGDLSFIEECLQTQVPDLTEAVIAFPESLLGLDAKLSDILKRWNMMPDKEGYRKENLDIQIALCEQLERISEPRDKDLIYQFLLVPFDEKEEYLNHLWESFYLAERAGRDIPFDEVRPDLSHLIRPDARDLPELELAYKICDLTFYYKQRFRHMEDLEEIRSAKQGISDMIMQILEEQKLPSKRCKYCGRPLPWNYRYNMCERCHKKHRWR